jgi:hypothetical protein
MTFIQSSCTHKTTSVCHIVSPQADLWDWHNLGATDCRDGKTSQLIVNNNKE